MKNINPVYCTYSITYWVGQKIETTTGTGQGMEAAEKNCKALLVKKALIKNRKMIKIN